MSNLHNEFSCLLHDSFRLRLISSLSVFFSFVIISLSFDSIVIFCAGCFFGGILSYLFFKRKRLMCSSCIFSGIRYANGKWFLKKEEENWQAIDLASNTLVLSGLIVLHFRIKGFSKKHSICCMSDSFDCINDYRKLRVWLRLSK